MRLGRLTRSDDLRQVWKDEARDFTPWLAENIEELSSILGLDLEVVEVEHPVGDFKVDILARDLGKASRLVVIENQLEPTDHNHLGQLLTYAAGLEAEIVVWICKEFRKEHRQTLDWLNRNHGGQASFIGIVVELIKVDDSQLAVDFRTVVLPPDWGAQSADIEGNEVSNRQKRYSVFFQKLLDTLRDNHRFTNARAAQPQNWYAFSTGIRGFKYAVSFANNGRIRAEIYIDTGNHDTTTLAFNMLTSEKVALEIDFGDELEWESLPEKRACRIALYRSGEITDAPDQLDEYNGWCVAKMLKFKEVFDAPLRSLNLDS